MKAKQQNKTAGAGKLDWLLWLVIVAAFVGGLWTNSFIFENVSGYIRVAAWIVLVLALVGLSLLTSKGKQAFDFTKSAKAELRKVFWPTRQETIQTTLMVIVVVVVVGILLWGVDSLFMWAVSWLTGQRG